MNISKTKKVFFIVLLLFFRINTIDSFNNEINIPNFSLNDSTAVVLIDTISVEGCLIDYIKYNASKKKLGNYSICSFVFLDSSNIVNNKEFIIRETGYYYLSKSFFSFFLKSYREYESNFENKTFRNFYKLNSDSIQPNPQELAIYNVVKNKEKIIISKIYKSRFQRFNISYQLIKRISPLIDIPTSIISDDGWVQVVVPL